MFHRQLYRLFKLVFPQVSNVSYSWILTLMPAAEEPASPCEEKRWDSQQIATFIGRPAVPTATSSQSRGAPACGPRVFMAVIKMRVTPGSLR